MEIVCLIVVSVVACGALALAYFLARRLPQSDYRAAQIMAHNNVVAWERGYHYGQENAGNQTEPITPALQLIPEAEPNPGPYDEESPTRIITPPSLQAVQPVPTVPE